MAGTSVVGASADDDIVQRPRFIDTAMYMAMWMHVHPLAKDPKVAVKRRKSGFLKMGVVAIDSDGILFAADYSREYSHAVMSLILKFGRRLHGSTLFVSRKPCSDCTKHMIQVGVKDVYYFPGNPEVWSKNDNGEENEKSQSPGDSANNGNGKETKGSQISVDGANNGNGKETKGSQSPCHSASNGDGKETKESQSPSDSANNGNGKETKGPQNTSNDAEDDKSLGKVEVDLGISDYIFKLSNMSIRMRIPGKLEGLAGEKQSDSGKDYGFELDFGKPYYKDKSDSKMPPGWKHVVSPQAMRRYEGGSEDPEEKFHERYNAALECLKKLGFDLSFQIENTPSGDRNELPFNMESKSDELCRHAATMTKILSKRTSDPKTGVGAVLMNPDGNYIGFGYNGYPRGINHSDVPGYGDKEEQSPMIVKYAYIIHAEANALTFCNKPCINHGEEKTVLVTSKGPCNHCYHNIVECGVKFVVTFDKKSGSKVESGAIGYGKYEENEAGLQKYLLKEKEMNVNPSTE